MTSMPSRSSVQKPFRFHLTYAAAVPLLLMTALAVLLFCQVIPQAQRANQAMRAISVGLCLLAGVILALFTARQLVHLSRAHTQAMERTEQQAEAIRESEQRFRAVFEQAAVGIAIATIDGRLLRFNSRLCEMTGYGAAELKQKTLADITHPDDRAASSAHLQGLMAGEGTTVFMEQRHEHRYMRKDGSTVWVALSASMARSASGRPPYLILIMDDISARKQAEQERTDLMLREQRARAEAETANRRKDQFVAMMSHELRTPLTPVLAKLEMHQRDANLPAEMADDLEMIRRNVELETRLIDDLLDLGTLSQGRMRLRMEVVDAHEKIRSALDIHGREIGAKKQRVTLDLRAERHLVRADAVRLQQVFWNLIGNAVKYTHEGGSILISTTEGPDGLLKAQVRDSGIGIEPEVMARLFNPFEQGEQSLIRRYGGVGLGLSISRSLVQMHGGRLTAASAGKDKGATFTVELPGAAPAAAAGPAAKARAGLRILLVEDNEDTLRVLARLLKTDGHQVKTATTLRTALATADSNDFDLLISDIGLPDGSGWELMRAIRGRASLHGIAVSGFTMEEDVRKSREAGFAEHLAKPINPQELEATIARLSPERPNACAAT